MEDAAKTDGGRKRSGAAKGEEVEEEGRHEWMRRRSASVADGREDRVRGR